MGEVCKEPGNHRVPFRDCVSDTLGTYRDVANRDGRVFGRTSLRGGTRTRQTPPAGAKQRVG